MITYGAASPVITYDMLMRRDICLREFHSAEWRESRYILIHLEHRYRLTERALIERLNALNFTLSSPVFGVNVVSTTTQVDSEKLGDHPGFRYIVDLFKQKSPMLTSWILSDDPIYNIFSYKRGYLYQYIHNGRSKAVHSSIPEVSSAGAGEAQSSGKTDLQKKIHLDTEYGFAREDKLYLEDFVQETLDALIEVSNEEKTYRQSEINRTEESLLRGEPQGMGFAYVAVCEAVVIHGRCAPKIGGTGRSNPDARLMELSRSLPVPFRLVLCIPSMQPFLVEAQLHQQFHDYRIKGRRGDGTCTEFFDVSVERIVEYVEENYPNARILQRESTVVEGVRGSSSSLRGLNDVRMQTLEKENADLKEKVRRLETSAREHKRKRDDRKQKEGENKKADAEAVRRFWGGNF